jgi:hypothetical protein
MLLDEAADIEYASMNASHGGEPAGIVVDADADLLDGLAEARYGTDRGRRGDMSQSSMVAGEDDEEEGLDADDLTYTALVRKGIGQQSGMAPDDDSALLPRTKAWAGTGAGAGGEAWSGSRGSGNDGNSESKVSSSSSSSSSRSGRGGVAGSAFTPAEDAAILQLTQTFPEFDGATGVRVSQNVRFGNIRDELAVRCPGSARGKGELRSRSEFLSAEIGNGVGLGNGNGAEGQLGLVINDVGKGVGEVKRGEENEGGKGKASSRAESRSTSQAKKAAAKMALVEEKRAAAQACVNTGPGYMKTGRFSAKCKNCGMERKYH